MDNTVRSQWTYSVCALGYIGMHQIRISASLTSVLLGPDGRRRPGSGSIRTRGCVTGRSRVVHMYAISREDADSTGPYREGRHRVSTE